MVISGVLFSVGGCVKSHKWYAPKGQKLLALGVMHPKAKRPYRAYYL